jgi:hypothetical protein
MAVRPTPNRHEIGLASARLLPTTSFGSQLLTRALRRGKSQLRRSQSALASAVADAGKCDRWKYGGAAHSRFTGQELDLICNHKFV